ncbi:MAG TPA: hypothetical protein VNJ08_17725 [Bacteriovoracaceae bacterium]|nr:hypothetical protein [Bacteriovoracaceae bacterium]
MPENNQTPEEMKNPNFSIKNAKKFESISEKMKKILESSEKLPQIPTKKMMINLPQTDRPTLNSVDAKALKEAMEGLTQFHDIFKEDQEYSDEIAQTNDVLRKLNDNFMGMVEIQKLQLKTLQSMLIEKKAELADAKENRTTLRSSLRRNILIALLAVTGIILYFEAKIDTTDKKIIRKIEQTKTGRTYTGPGVSEPPVKELLFSPEK